jgi:hypothetical protein
MATINISDLRLTGSDLFSDSESYMNELSEGEFSGVLGGNCAFSDVTAAASVGAATLSTLGPLGAPVGAVLGSGIYATYCLS